MSGASRTCFNIVHTENSCGWGGQEIRVLTEALGMLNRGHMVQLVCPAEAPLFAAARSKGLPVHALDITRKRLPHLWALGKWLANQEGIDVINTHSSTDSWLAALAVKIWRQPIAVVRTRHVSTPVPDNWTTRWLYQSASDHIVTTGEALRYQLQRENGYRLETMTSVPTGIDLNFFKPLPHQEARKQLSLVNKNYLGIVATLRNWKGYTYLLDAFATLSERWPNWDLLIVGDGPQRNNIVRRIGELNLSERVHMVGNRDDVPLWLNAMDIFVLPSYGSEGVPQSILQAMACARPVVSTTVGAIGEAVEPDKTGLLVEPRNTAALTERLEQLMTHPDLRHSMGEAGHQKARREFSLDIMLDRMEAVYGRVIAEKRQRCAE